MERDGRHIEEPDEGGRQNVLARMLLHVIAPTRIVDPAAHLHSLLRRLLGLQVVNNSAVFPFLHLRHAEPRIGRGFQPAGVKDLASAGGIEGGAIKNDAVPRVDGGRGNDLDNLAIKLTQKRIVVVQTLAHRH